MHPGAYAGLAKEGAHGMPPSGTTYGKPVRATLMPSYPPRSIYLSVGSPPLSSTPTCRGPPEYPAATQYTNDRMPGNAHDRLLMIMGRKEEESPPQVRQVRHPMLVTNA